MRRLASILLALQAVLVLALVAGVASGWMSLGVRGEWEWPRIAARPGWPEVALGGAAIAAYSAFAALGMKALSRRVSRRARAGWVTGLVGAAVAVQAAILSTAPAGYGLTKWVTLAMHGSSGYYEVARSQMSDPGRFWAEYPEWVRRQDALHIGTHPPGLFLLSRAAIGLMESHADLARAVADHLPGSVEAGFRQILGPLPRADRAALALIGGLTLLACAASVVPLYLLARRSHDPSGAWAAASLWPLVPAAVLFHPTADTAFPLLATSALALAAAGSIRRGFGAGVVLALGMQMTLAYFAVGLVAALILATTPGRPWAVRLAAIGATGAGFLGATLAIWAASGANPFLIWWWNQRNHARFYAEYPRSYLAWLAANPIELTVALGLPAAVWAVVGLSRSSETRPAWSTLAVLAILSLSGRSLGEVARLWLPLMPPLLVASASGLARSARPSMTLAATLVLMGAQTLALQAMIQVVYPV